MQNLSQDRRRKDENESKHPLGWQYDQMARIRAEVLAAQDTRVNYEIEKLEEKPYLTDYSAPDNDCRRRNR